MAKGRKGKDFEPTDGWVKAGSKNTKSTASERLAFVREEWEKDINIPINGRGGMSRRLSARFGKTARDEQLIKIRAEVREKLKKEKDRKKPGNAMTTVLSKEQRDDILNMDKSKPTPPKPKPEPEQLTMPMVPAIGAGKSAEDVRARYSFAKDYLRKNPHAYNKEVEEVLRARFGVAISSRVLGDIRRELGVGRTRRRYNEVRYCDRKPVVRVKVEDVRKEEEERTDMQIAKKKHNNPQNAIRAAVQMLLEEVPSLRKLELNVDSSGKPTVKWEVYTVSAGEMEI